MSGPDWEEDIPQDFSKVEDNAYGIVAAMAYDTARHAPTLHRVRVWHRMLYAGCWVPSEQYRGGLRGDATLDDLVDYEVGVGPIQPDGLPERMGVWASMVSGEVTSLMDEFARVVADLDLYLPPGRLPKDADELNAVVTLAARMHGEWLRIHPFANGNGRTARLWCAWLALRYGLPVFVTVKPRPLDAAYLAAGRESMGRAPRFEGNHEPTRGLFARMLRLTLEGR